MVEIHDESLKRKILKIITRTQMAVYLCLMLILTIMILIGLVVYVVSIASMFTTGSMSFGAGDLIAVFDMFLLILIGLELMDSIKSFVETQKIDVSIFLVLAIIAVARKLIIVDLTNVFDGIINIGVGIILIALTAGYYLVRKADYQYLPKKDEK